MHHVMIRYTVEPEHAQENVELLAAFYRELAAAAPESVSHTTYQLDDGISFVDVVATDSPARFAQLPSFQRFRSTLEQRCQAPPVMTELHPIGAYQPR